MNYQISVIIPTFQRYEYITQVLKLLNEQTVKPLEIIIVDASHLDTNFSPPDNSNIVVYIPVNFIGNISRQRNIAITQARGNILLFIDDDVIFSPDFIENYINAFVETSADGICGIILDNGKRRKLDYMKKKRPFLLNPGGVNFRYEDSVSNTHVISTANFACKKDAIINVGGFDEEIYGSIEDVELGLRLVNAGYKIIHHNKPIVNHLAVNSSGSRSPSIGLTWKNSNFYYFQMKHFYNNKHLWLLLLSCWDVMRPSRTWLDPIYLINYLRALLPAFNEAEKRIKRGPHYIASKI